MSALPDPWNDAAVAEADRQLGAELDTALHALDDAHHVGRPAARRHEVEYPRDRAVLRLPRGLEDERIVEVATGVRGRNRRSEEPAAVLGVAEEGGEAGSGVEAGEAEPVDGAAAVDERHRLKIA